MIDEPSQDVGGAGAEPGPGEVPEAYAEPYEQDTLLSDVHEERTRARVAWSLVPREVFSLLFANCLFFAGTLAVWSRSGPGDAPDLAQTFNGLYSIKGSVIFALALYGFWTSVFNIWHRQAKIWPFLITALVALWVGVGRIVSTIDSEAWHRAVRNLEARETRTIMDEVVWRVGTVPPGQWLLTFGGIIVLVVLIRGVMTGAKTAKASGRRR